MKLTEERAAVVAKVRRKNAEIFLRDCDGKPIVQGDSGEANLLRVFRDHHRDSANPMTFGEVVEKYAIDDGELQKLRTKIARDVRKAHEGGAYVKLRVTDGEVKYAVPNFQDARSKGGRTGQGIMGAFNLLDAINPDDFDFGDDDELDTPEAESQADAAARKASKRGE